MPPSAAQSLAIFLTSLPHSDHVATASMRERYAGFCGSNRKCSGIARSCSCPDRDSEGIDQNPQDAIGILRE
jgi:hypothetical protein